MQYSYKPQINLNFTTMRWQEGDAPAILVISPRPHLAPPEARRISDKRATRLYASSKRFRFLFDAALDLCLIMIKQALQMALEDAKTQRERDRAVSNSHRAAMQFSRWHYRIRGIKEIPF